jgi:hypothetical protein
MRATIDAALPDTANILNVTYTPDGQGGYTDNWGTASVSVPCRLAFERGLETIAGGGLQPFAGLVLTMPYNTALTTANRVEQGGVLYDVKSVDTGKSNNLCVRAQVGKIGIVSTVYVPPVVTLAALRDIFTTELPRHEINGTMSEPGHGKRFVKDIEWVINLIEGRLRGGGQPLSAVWGDGRIYWTDDAAAGFTRLTGRTLVGLIVPEDTITTCDIAFGWDIATNTADPRTVGHGWLIENGGQLMVINPGVKTTIEGTTRNIRPIQYLVMIALNDVGAYTLISSLAAYIGTGSTDPLGIPAYPSARLLWSDYGGTTTPLYPYMSSLSTLGYPNGNSLEDIRIIDVSTWTAADFLATAADRFTRDDSTTSAGPGWTAVAGTWGISSNQAYVAADEAAGNLDYMFRDGGNADGLFTFRVKMPASGASMCHCILRAAAGVKFISAAINLGTSSLKIEVWDGGPNPAHEVASVAYTWVNGSTYDITVMAYGNQYAVWVDGVLKIGWTADAGSHFLTATGVGYGVRGRNIIATWAAHRFDNIAAYPHTLTIPTDLTTGKVPDILTGGSTLASDTFTDTDAVRLNAHTAESGGAWTEHTGTWTVQTNRASCACAAGENFATQDIGSVDAEVTADCITPGTFATDYLTSGVTVRYVDANNYIAVKFIMAVGSPNQDEIEIHELIDGAGGVVKKINLANFYAVGTTYSLKVQCKDDLIQVILDGKPRLSYYTQSGSPMGTRFGLNRNNQDDGVVFDNWTVKAL